MKLRAMLLSSCALLSSRLGAASDVLIPRGTETVGASAVGPSGGLGAYTVFVAAVLGVAGVWFLWRSRRQTGSRASRGKLSVSETRSLGNRQYLVVAAYGEKRYLIGVCVGRISLLAPLDDADSPPSA
jgi:flagellar protein FliO/FliZ